MIDIVPQDAPGTSMIAAPVGRRALMGSIAALSAATVSMPTFAADTVALTTYTGKYAMPGGKIIDGFMAAPRGRSGLAIVVVMPGEGQSIATRRAMAQDYAAAGYLAIAPDGVNGAAGRSVSALTAVLPAMKRIARGDGTVRVVLG